MGIGVDVGHNIRYNFSHPFVMITNIHLRAQIQNKSAL